jgi:GTP-binding protein
MPTVAIVGRPNVGKSALFNRLVQRRIAIVHDQPGVTRDRLIADCRLGSKPFTVVDTGGIAGASKDALDDQVHSEAKLAIEMADVILFVGDAQDGVTPPDRSIARDLRSARKPVILVANKVDDPKHDPSSAEFSELGFEPVLAISAAHGRGIRELVAEIDYHLPGLEEPLPDLETPTKLVVVGRPNVGKSSLINAILKDRRTLVSNTSGTTRDSVDIAYEREGKSFVLIDTAGIRPRGRHNSSVEVFSVMRSEKSIRRSHVCVLVIDATTGVTAQDKKIAGLIQRAEKACIIVMNKLDLVRPKTQVRTFMDALIRRIRNDLFFLSYAPIDVLSAHTGENLERLFKSVTKIERHSRKTISTGQLNRLLENALAAHPPSVRGTRRLKILYATQLADRGGIQAPTFLLFVNNKDLLDQSYRRYLENKIREQAGYYGLPVIFKLRERHRSKT